MPPPDDPAMAPSGDVTMPPDLSILGSEVSLHPPGFTAQTDSERELIETMARFRRAPLDFFREVGLHVSGTGWRSYEDVVGQPIFYPGFSEKMRDAVLGSPMLQAKIAELARRRVEVEVGGHLCAAEEREARERVLRAQLGDVADKWTDAMICKMDSKRFIRSAYYLVTQLLTRAYHQGIHVSSEEVVALRHVAAQAAKKKQSIIFLPCHKSHVDYVSLQIICYRLGIGLPTVVAGDNLNFPLVGPFLQHAGAMWIRRSFGDDQLYGTLVQAYIDTLLQGGFNFECFIEGGRSRTGKLLGPKFGILRFLLDSVLSGRVEDAIVCPVSTAYDKVIEVDSYISELLGQPKPKENLRDFLSASSILSLKLGRVDVRFHKPWSLREFCVDQFARFDAVPGPLETEPERRVRLLRSLGYRVLADINEVSVTMPTALIGTVLLTLRGRGVGRAELIRRVEWLCERVRAAGGRVAHFGGQPTGVVVERGLEVLGSGLVGRVDGLVEETYFAVDRFQLSFYRNMTIHLFILEALVSAALYTRVKAGGGAAAERMPWSDLRRAVFFLSQLFRGEFIFPPEGLDANLARTVARLEGDAVLTVTHAAGVGDEEGKGEILTVELSAKERESGRENFDFYCFLIWPFVEASWLGAVSLIMLAPPAGTEGGSAWLGMKAVQNAAQVLGKTLYHQGDLSYFEAVNKETLKNAYARFEEEGIVVVSKGPRGEVVRLAEEWVPMRGEDGKVRAEGRLWEFAEGISAFRREGKNRRDGGTVRRRVLGLVETVGGLLFEEERGAGGEVRARGRRRRVDLGRL
ncbi:acyltransferase-domain-containing protein [Trichodelitschia bisporula]|uniref:Acyltransferase-domain-containing protein n=1 Tax=Trichodelitschia bisporula TaxID=703511 RepID=A0A6G1HKV9_9PEZI|nr:acyltransferase-domain-containing protein [Trichodelitschia bisporula]